MLSRLQPAAVEARHHGQRQRVPVCVYHTSIRCPAPMAHGIYPRGSRAMESMLTIGPDSTACNCHGHAYDCYYDPEVDQRNASQNQDNVYQGGGVCLDCQVG